MNVDSKLSHNSSPHESGVESAGGPPPQLRERLRDQTQAAIIAAAEQVLAEQGLDASVQAIAARAGVAVGTLYNHFGDRDGLVHAVINHNRQALLQAIDALLAEPDGDFRRMLQRLAETFTHHWRLHGPFLALIMQEHSHSRDRCARQDMAQSLRVRLQRLVAHGRETGQLRSDIGDVHADMLMGLFWGLMARSLFGGAPESEGQAAAELFWRGAAANPR